jgi:uncharacterized delta-60 repeat protein
MLVQPDGKILVAGAGDLVRLNPDGTFDNDFDGDGAVSVSSIGELALQSDGKIIALTGNLMRRLTAEGSLDPTFGAGGFIGVGPGATSHVAVTAEDSIICVGVSDSPRRFLARRFLADGSPDTTFDGDGTALVDHGLANFPHPFVYTRAVLQADGKIVAFNRRLGPSDTLDLAMVRVATDGSLDANFGSAGKVTTDIPAPGADVASAIAETADGKLIVAGLIGGKPGVVRYNANGTLDTTFGTGGRTVSPFNTFFSSAKITLQTDGKIVFAGTWWDPSISQTVSAVARVNADGTMDTSFDGDGVLIIDYSAKSLVIQADGKIIVGSSGSNGEFALARLNPNGSPDTSFSGDGWATSGPLNGGGGASGLAIRGDGKIVAVGGYVPGATGHDVAAALFNPDGSLDTTFGSAGLATVDFGGWAWDEARDVVVQPDNRIVVLGFKNDQSYTNDIGLVRFNANGTLDATFGNGTGKVLSDLASGGDEPVGIALQSDGKFVVASSSASGTSLDNRNFVAARYLPDGRIDATFGNRGYVITDFGASWEFAADMLIQSDGGIVLAGHTTTPTTGPDLALVRYTSGPAANNIWTGLGDGATWSDPFNWSNNHLPGRADDAIVLVAGDQTINITGAQAVRSVLSERALNISGSLSLSAQSTFLGGAVHPRNIDHWRRRFTFPYRHAGRRC